MQRYNLYIRTADRTLIAHHIIAAFSFDDARIKAESRVARLILTPEYRTETLYYEIEEI